MNAIARNVTLFGTTALLLRRVTSHERLHSLVGFQSRINKSKFNTCPLECLSYFCDWNTGLGG